jgi:hypothetical protein
MIRVYDQNGKVVAEDYPDQGSGMYKWQKDLSGQAKGIYYLSILQDGKKVRTEKIILD